MDEPALLVRWERLLGQILDKTGAFPRSARFSFAARIDSRALDILECLAAARYSAQTERRDLLASTDRHLAVLRVLLRVAFDRRFLDIKGLEFLSTEIDECGRMLGAWRSWLERQG